MNDIKKKMQDIGDNLVDIFHFFSLFVIGGTIVWSAVFEYLSIMDQGHAKLKDILLLFIYLELGAMVGIYFKTHRLPVQYLIYIAITALARHLVIDVQEIKTDFHLYLLVSVVVSILLLSFSVLIFSYSAKKHGRPEDHLDQT